MTAADDYNAAQLAAGKLTYPDITELVKHWQASHPQLEVDGKAGDKTIASIRAAMRPPPPPFLRSPLPVLPDGRGAVITSAFRPKDRPNHNGLDLFYRWQVGDRPDFVGNGGCAGANQDGTPRWVVPYDTLAIAAAPGVVQRAENSKTGYLVWIDHGNGLRSGYFHLRDCRVLVGRRVELGQSLGEIGDNPSDHDARHLHFELSPVDRYSPMDPAPYMVGA